MPAAIYVVNYSLLASSAVCLSLDYRVLCVEPVLMNAIWDYVQATVHLLLLTLPVRHWRAYTKGKACTRCLRKAIEWVNGILEIYHESIINCVGE